MNELTLFVAGTPTNKIGFQYKEISGGKLPGNPPSYIDRFEKDKMDKGRSFYIDKVDIRKRVYTLIVEYRAILPNDQDTSRGAYISVGALIPGIITFNKAVDVCMLISEVHGHLLALRGNSQKFGSSFELGKYTVGIDSTLDYAATIVTYLTCKSLDVSKSGKYSYNSVADNGNHISPSAGVDIIKEMHNVTEALKEKEKALQEQGKILKENMVLSNALDEWKSKCDVIDGERLNLLSEKERLLMEVQSLKKRGLGSSKNTKRTSGEEKLFFKKFSTVEIFLMFVLVVLMVTMSYSFFSIGRPRDELKDGDSQIMNSGEATEETSKSNINEKRKEVLNSGG